MKTINEVINMDQNKCKDCAHFLQHYILNDTGLLAVQCGHCTHIRAKTKRPYAKACSDFATGTPDTARFATRAYLTKKLLQDTLELELLPEILALAEEHPAASSK